MSAVQQIRFGVWPTAEERFWAQVEKTPDCWLWTGSCTDRGYGTLRVDGRTQRVHRYAYELLVGPIPEGLTIDHLCRVRNCVNPDHMEPVTQRENVLRGDSPAAQFARRDPCPPDHEYEVASNGYRQCATCRRERQRLAWPERKRRRDERVKGDG